MKALPVSIHMMIFYKTKLILNPYTLAHAALMTSSVKVEGQGQIFVIEIFILKLKCEGY
jgi:hypothetical protein